MKKNIIIVVTSLLAFIYTLNAETKYVHKGETTTLNSSECYTNWSEDTGITIKIPYRWRMKESESDGVTFCNKEQLMKIVDSSGKSFVSKYKGSKTRQNIYCERIEKEIVVLEKKLNLNLLSLIENKKFDSLQNKFIPYIALYSNIENKEKRLSLLFLMDKINFIIKTKYIRDEYFNSDNPLSSINMVPEKIDGQGGIMSGMLPDSPSLTKLEQEAYKNKLKLREEYLKEENIHLAAKSFYKTCLYFFNKYVSLELEKNNLTKK